MTTGVTHYVGTFRDITSRKEREARLQHLSHLDPLTDLPNRALLLNRLDQSIRRARRLERQVALLFIDLDNFKAVNDTAGHLVGDRVLKEVATRLASVVRDMDTVARVGGDEFAILLSDVEAREQVVVIADRILDVLSRPVELSGGSYACRCSIGISLGPRRDDDPEHVLERADAAMYLAKRHGGGRFAFAE
jgi:diguanylate cyclase (GGDEF)-like protein